MNNPILQALSAQKQIPTQGSNPMQMIRQFAEFKKMMNGKNPQAIVRELLSSGKMSQQQFEALKSQAQELSNILK